MKSKKWKNKIVKGFRSRFELEIALQIEKSGREVIYESKEDILSYSSDYHPDFSLLKKSGGKMLIEVKGYFPADQRAKMKKVKRDNPDKDIRIIFEGNRKIYKNSNIRYLDWAEKEGFPAALKRIPQEWIDETI